MPAPLSVMVCIIMVASAIPKPTPLCASRRAIRSQPASARTAWISLRSCSVRSRSCQYEFGNCEQICATPSRTDNCVSVNLVVSRRRLVGDREKVRVPDSTGSSGKTLHRRGHNTRVADRNIGRPRWECRGVLAQTKVVSSGPHRDSVCSRGF